MSLSLGYIAIIVLTIIIMILGVGISSLNENWFRMILTIAVCGGIIIGVYTIGSKYGKYGLEILLSKLLQPGIIRNDFPMIAPYLGPEDKTDKKEEKKNVQAK